MPFLYIYYKKMIRKTIFLYILLLAAFCAQAANKLLVVEMPDGGKVYFALSENPELTFNGQTMRIMTTLKSQGFEIANVAQYYFTDETTGIKALKTNELRISQSGDGQVTIEGLQPSSAVRLFSLDGKEQPTSVKKELSPLTPTALLQQRTAIPIFINSDLLLRISRPNDGFEYEHLSLGILTR